MEVQKLEISVAPGHLPSAALAPNPYAVCLLTLSRSIGQRFHFVRYQRTGAGTSQAVRPSLGVRCPVIPGFAAAAANV